MNMVGRITGLRQLHQLGRAQQPRPARGAESFDDLLKRRVDGARSLKFSAHAQERIRGRGIALDDGDLKNLRDAGDVAASKGSREALLLMKDIGFIVNVPNRTVLTALDTRTLNERIVTNIDSVVFVPDSSKT